MAYEIHVEEDYNLVELTDESNSDELTSLAATLMDGLLETPYVVLHQFGQLSMDEDVISILTALNNEVMDRKGLLLLVAFNEAERDAFEANDLTTIPTLDEAVDFIFMDRLEKELEED